MTKKRIIQMLVALTVMSSFWLFANPLGRFGWCCFGYATYGAWPRPINDFQVRADGMTRQVEKTHQLAFEQIEWLLEPKPEVLIIALGWDSKTSPDHRIREYGGCEVHLLSNIDAIDLYNQLKQSGKQVAIHYHSTC